MASADEPWLLTRETLSSIERVFLGAFALLPLWAVWDLVVRPWPAVLSGAGLLIVPIALASLAVGGAFLLTSLLAPEREVRVDPRAREIVVTQGARWLGRWDRRIPFADIGGVVVQKDGDTDGPDRFELVLALSARRPPLRLMTRPADRRAELEDIAARLRTALQP